MDVGICWVEVSVGVTTEGVDSMDVGVCWVEVLVGVTTEGVDGWVVSS
jgi:hypothetical protein